MLINLNRQSRLCCKQYHGGLLQQISTSGPFARRLCRGTTLRNRVRSSTASNNFEIIHHSHDCSIIHSYQLHSYHYRQSNGIRSDNSIDNLNALSSYLPLPSFLGNPYKSNMSALSHTIPSAAFAKNIA